MFGSDGISDATHIPPFKKYVFFMVRTLNMRSTLNKFLSVQYSVVKYSHCVLHKLSRTYSFCIIEILCQLISNSLFFFCPQAVLTHTISSSAQKVLALASKDKPHFSCPWSYPLCVSFPSSLFPSP